MDTISLHYFKELTEDMNVTKCAKKIALITTDTEQPYCPSGKMVWSSLYFTESLVSHSLLLDAICFIMQIDGCLKNKN